AGSTTSPPPPSPESISIGWSTAHPTWITMALSGFSPGGNTYTCNFASGGDASCALTVTTNPETIDNGHTCYDTEAGDTVWVTIGSVSSNTITVAGSTTSPPPPSTESISIGWSTAHPTWITMALSGFSPGGYTYTCNFASGGDASYALTVTTNPETRKNGRTSEDTVAGGTVWLTIDAACS